MARSPSVRPLAAARQARVHLVHDASRVQPATDPVPVGEELERFMSELGRLVADLWFEGRLDAPTRPADAFKRDE